MAFKMKGSAFKLNEVATKSALKQGKSPIKDSGSEWLNTLNEQGMDTGDSEKAYAKKHDRKHAANNPMDPPHGEPKDTTETEESMRKGAEISGALPMESPMKTMGIYTTDEFGNKIQISEAEYERTKDLPGPSSYTFTGKDAKYDKELAPRSDKTGKTMTKEEYTRAQNKSLVRDYELKGPKGNPALGKEGRRRAAIIDKTIQDKINEGIELTPEEKEYQAKALKNL